MGSKISTKDGIPLFNKGGPAWNRGIPSPLSAMQKLFIQEYLIDLSPLGAYQRAGYKGEGVAAKVNASKLVRNPKVMAGIQQAMSARLERLHIDQDRVLQEYAKIAFLDPRRFYDENGQLLPVHLMPQDVAAALTSVDIVSLASGDGPAAISTAKVKFADKKGALDSIARHLGMFVEKVEHTGPGGGPQEHVHKYGGTAEDAYRQMLEPKQIGKK